MGTHFRKHTDKDPLCGFFRWGSRLFPITNSHICIVDGHVALGVLEQTLSNVVQRFESLRDLWDEKAMNGRENEIFKVASTTQTIAFDSPDFRRELMDFVAKSTPKGLLDYPLKLHIMHAEDRSRSCVHLGISHDLADVKSGNILLSALLEEYQRLLSPTVETSPHESAQHHDKKLIHAHLPLAQLKPNWYEGAAPLRRQARAYLEIAKRMSTRQRSRVVAAPVSRDIHNEAGDTDERNDFFHQTLPEALQGAILEAAKRHHTTVNTLFSAALVRYIASHQGNADSPAVYTMAVSLRKLLGDAYNDAFRSFMIDCRLRIPPDADTSKLLRSIQSEVEAIRQGGLELEVGRMENAIPLFRQPLPKALVYWIMKRTQGTNILYSNPGVVEENLDNFGSDSLPIREVAIFGCLVHPYDLMFLTPMVSGRLQLTVVYRRKVFQDIQQQFVSPFLRELDGILA